MAQSVDKFEINMMKIQSLRAHTLPVNTNKNSQHSPFCGISSHNQIEIRQLNVESERSQDLATQARKSMMVSESTTENGYIISNTNYGDKYSLEMLNPPNRYTNPVIDAKLIKFRKVIKNRFLISGFINKNYNYPRIFEDEKGVYGKYGHIKMINFMPKMSS